MKKYLIALFALFFCVTAYADQLGTINSTTSVPTVVGSPTTGNCAEWDASDNLVDSGGTCGGGGSVAGSDTQIQYNNSGAFGASSKLTWNDSTEDLYADGDVTLGDDSSVSNRRLFGIEQAPDANTDGNGLIIYAGQGNGSGDGGNLTITAGDMDTTGNGGLTRIAGGYGGGDFQGYGGDGDVNSALNAGDGGSATIKGGAADLSGGAGGDAYVIAGASDTEDGANVHLIATDGDGTNKNGGDVFVTPGSATGSGTPGLFKLTQGGMGFIANDTFSDCSAYSSTGGGIFYDDSEGIFKKCQDNTLSDLDTTGSGAASYIIISASTSTNDTATSYLNPFGTSINGGESNRDYWEVPIDCTVQKLRCRVNTAPGTSNAWDCTIRYGSPGSMGTTGVTCQIPDTSVNCSDTSNSQALTAGNVVTFQLAETGSAAGHSGYAMSAVCEISA